MTDSASLRQVPFRIENPQLIPARRYYDEAFFRLENEHLWPHVWQMACRTEQIPEVGDWIAYENLGKSVIVVRTREGIKAFHNACRHRGMRLADGHGNCRVQGFICPFHGWRWNMDGKNTFVYARQKFDEAVLAPGEIALRPCRAEVQLGCVFINFDDAAPSFADTIGPLLERLDLRNTGRLRAEWWYATVLPANWKVTMEAFMEGYHAMRTHPQLHQVMPAMFNAHYGADMAKEGETPPTAPGAHDNIRAKVEHYAQLNEGMAGQVHAKEVEIARALLEEFELPEDPAQTASLWSAALLARISGELRARGEPVPDLAAVGTSHPIASLEFLFPNYFLLPFFTSMAAYRVRPLGPETCLFESWSLTFYPEGEEPEAVLEPTMLRHDNDDYPLIPRQDFRNIPGQQRGLHAEGFDHMRLGKNIEGLISNYQRLIDGHIAGVDPQTLAAATHKLAGNFDGAIEDLGFETVQTGAGDGR